MKITATSDIHGNLLDNLPSGDVLTISGDICPVDRPQNQTVQGAWINSDFIPWCKNLLYKGTFKDIVFCAGNHDSIFFKNKTIHTTFPEHIHYLEDKNVTVQDKVFHGTPWSPPFGNWAFMKPEYILQNYHVLIPENCDVLLSHSPARDYNDVILQEDCIYCYGHEKLGSISLLQNVKRAVPKYLLVGHIHSGDHNVKRLPSCNYLDDNKFTNSVNVSLLDESYNVFYKPFEFEI